jgi:hypothetical protein
MTALAPPEPCVACTRLGTRTETRTVNDGHGRIVLPLCIDPVDCRRHWPAQGRAGVRG